MDLANMQKIQTRLGLTISMLNTVKAHVEVQADKAKERKIQVNEWIMFLFTWVAEPELLSMGGGSRRLGVPGVPHTCNVWCTGW